MSVHHPSGNLAAVWQHQLAPDRADRLAFIDCTTPGGIDEPEVVTYAAFEDRVARVAGGFAARGIGPGDRVAILADNSVDYATVYFAAPRIGAVIVPLNAKLPVEGLTFVTGDAAVRLIVHDEANAARLPAGYDTIAIGSDAWRDLLAAEPAPIATVAPDDVAVQMYTSGSTGRPKGVLLSHGSQRFTIEQYTAGGFFMDVEERIVVSAPMYHKNAMVQTKVNLALGGQIVLLARFAAREYLQAVATHRATSLTGVPTMFALMTAETALLDELDLSSVRRMMIGSAPMTEAFFDQVQQRFPQAGITNGYGTTEAIAVFGPHPDGAPRPKIALGHPLPTVEVRLVDAADGTVTYDSTDPAPPPAHAAGELWIRSPGVMNGYHNLAEVTAARLTEGWYHTGDVMERDAAGWFFFVGRVDDMFVCGGENVYPGEVEQLLERHSAIHQAAVVAVADELKGALPVAFVVVSPGQSLTEEEIRRWAIEHGPAYQHPRAVWFLDEIPLAGTAKIDKTALTAEAARRFVPR